jgi:endonuclease YncB( thermonuclease family)
MNPSLKRAYIMFVAVLVIIVALSFGIYLISIYEHDGKLGDGPYVLEVLDGDTFKMSDGSIIRLLCVDTPEKGEEDYHRASKFLESLVLYRDVRLEKPETLDEVDKYNRDLRFVYVDTPAGEVFVNEEIIRLGFGDMYTYQDSEGECVRTLGR